MDNHLSMICHPSQSLIPSVWARIVKEATPDKGGGSEASGS